MKSVDDLLTLPANLPVPLDDGACDHLPQSLVPGMLLQSTAGGTVDLSVLPGRTVVYCYPRTGEAGKTPPQGWDEIPGARGCTPQSCGFRDHHSQLQHFGARVFGLSTQTTEYQREVVDRLRLPFPLLSDAALEFTHALRLPTFEFSGMTLIKRLALVMRDGRIEHVFYPVFPPDRNAADVLTWLSERVS
ncbi:MAG: redoxin family protein [Chloroflexota bacterium]